MIIYSWIALGRSDPTARNETDPIARNDSDRTTPSEGGRTAPSRGGWSTPGGSTWPGGVPVAMGITDDQGRAMKAGEEALDSGRAVVVIIEAVRPGMAAHTLAPCYVRTGAGWVGRRSPAGEVTWDRFFL
jgi:hypothetical protein